MAKYTCTISIKIFTSTYVVKSTILMILTIPCCIAVSLTTASTTAYS